MARRYSFLLSYLERTRACFALRALLEVINEISNKKQIKCKYLRFDSTASQIKTELVVLMLANELILDLSKRGIL